MKYLKDSFIKDTSTKRMTYLMMVITYVSVMGVIGFIYITTEYVCELYQARDFLGGLQAVPWSPGIILRNEILLLGLLVVCYFLREYYFKNNLKGVYGTLVLEFVISIIIIILLDFNYNGILLYVFANIVAYAKNGTGKIILFIIGVSSYVITEFSLVSLTQPMYNIQHYFGVFDVDVQAYLVGGYTLLKSITIVCFIIFCILVIQEQRGTIREVNELYDQLTKKHLELTEANQKLEQYALIKEKMGETRERNRLAREIHDTLGHTLTGISAGLDASLTTLEISPEQTKKQLEVISNVAREGIKEIRRSVNQLRPDALERQSLEMAIRKLVEETNSLMQVKVDFYCTVSSLKFDEDEENAIYRVIQEGITNAIRHGKASQITVRIDKKDGTVHLQIKDNGCGCKEIKSGFGIHHITERIRMLNGTVHFNGQDGFLIEAAIPIRWGEDYD